MPPSRVQIGDVPPLDRRSFNEEDLKFAAKDFQSRKFHYEAVGEQIFKREDYLIEDFAVERMGIFWDRAQPYRVNQKPWYTYMYGDMESAALFISEVKENLINLHRTVGEDTRDLFSMFEKKIVDGNAVIEKLDSTFGWLMSKLTHTSSLSKRFQQPRNCTEICPKRQLMFEFFSKVCTSLLGPRAHTNHRTCTIHL